MANLAAVLHLPTTTSDSYLIYGGHLSRTEGAAVVSNQTDKCALVIFLHI